MPSTAVDAPIVDPETIDEEYVHVVAAIVWRDAAREAFLIAQRQPGKHLAHLWEFPGGKRETGESVWQALCRELEEEIDIRPTRAAPFMRVYQRYPERNVLLDTWVVDAYDGAVAARERQDLRWITIAQIGDYRFPPADVPILDAIASSETTGKRRPV